MTPICITAAWFVGGYLAGSMPFGWLIGRVKGVDIRQHGSRNIGATNCGRVCGVPWGVLAFLLDVAKGLAPVLAAVEWFPVLVGAPAGTQGAAPGVPWLPVTIVAVSPILGHVFPVWLRFRGGKGVATSLGVLFAFPMLQALAVAAFGVWVLAVLVTRYVSVGSTAAAITFGAGYLVFEREQAWAECLPVTVFVLVLVLTIILRHRSNYARLLKGTENRIGGRKEKPPASDAGEEAEDAGV